jgi:uncharacterized phage protein gp47/JayE
MTPTPTTDAIATNITARISSSISQTIPLLPKSFTAVLAKVLAGVFVMLWKYAGWMFLQQFVRTASFSETEINGKVVRPLVEWGVQVGVGEPRAAGQAEHTVTVTVINQVGSLAAGSQLVYPSTGIVYLTQSAVALNAATVVVTVTASSDPSGGDGSGVLGNLQSGDQLSFANPLPSVSGTAVVLARTVDGVDAEGGEVYRARVLARCQQKPQGGAYADYKVWGEEALGVLHVFPYAGLPGEVDCYVESPVTINVDGIPGSTELAAALASITLDQSGLASRRPIGSAVNVLPITRTAFNLTITGLLPNTATIMDAISSGVDEHLRSLEPFIVGLSTLPRLDRVTLGAVGGVVNEIAAANGATMTAVALYEGASLMSARSLAAGEKAKLGVITWL